MVRNYLVAEKENLIFATKFILMILRFMTLICIFVIIFTIHALFLLYPVYRDEALDVYTWTPWTEKEYVLFRKVTGSSKAVKIRLLINWILWPFLILFIAIMPFVFLFKLPGILNEYDGEITYSKDGKSLLKVADNCRRVKVREGVEVIASEAFDSTRVTHVKLPDTVKILKPNALLRAHYLESINLPDSIIKIDRYAFQFCGGFGKGLKEVVLPKHLHYLGENAFYGCEKLEKLVLRGDFKWKESWLENNPFYYTKNLSDIKSSNSNFKVEDGMLVSSDGKILFRCVNDTKRVTIKDVVLPEGTESIGIESFSFCWNLKTMTLPSTLKNIAYNAFEHSDHLQNFIFPKGMEEEFEKKISEGKCNLPF